jgi:hypothetical protein
MHVKTPSQPPPAQRICTSQKIALSNRFTMGSSGVRCMSKCSSFWGVRKFFYQQNLVSLLGTTFGVEVAQAAAIKIGQIAKNAYVKQHAAPQKHCCTKRLLNSYNKYLKSTQVGL